MAKKVDSKVFVILTSLLLISPLLVSSRSLEGVPRVIPFSGTISYLDGTPNPFGVQVWWNTEPQQMDMCKELGVGWVRLDTHWNLIETSEEVFDWSGVWFQEADLAIERGMKPLFILMFNRDHAIPSWVTKANLYQQFKDFVYAVVKRYNLDAVELFNEPIEFGTHQMLGGLSAEEYVDLCIKAGYEGAKLANPNCIVVSAFGYGYVVDDIWKSAYGLGYLVQHGFLDYSDALAIHPYTWNVPPEDFLATPIQNLKNYLAGTSKPDIPLWATEWGIDAYIVGEETQAEWLVRQAQLMWDDPQIVMYCYFDTYDGRTNRWVELFRSNPCTPESARPAYYAYQQLISSRIL